MLTGRKLYGIRLPEATINRLRSLVSGPDYLALQVAIERFCDSLEQSEKLGKVCTTPDGHFKLPHLWPVKLPHGGRLDYDDSALMTMRAAASLSR